MHFRLYENDEENAVFELDGEAIEYFIDGLEALKEAEAGEELTTPSLIENEETEEVLIGEMIIKRMADVHVGD